MKFQTSEAELQSRLHECRPSITQVGLGLDSLISRQFQCAPMDLAFASKGLPYRDQAYALLSETLILKKTLGLPSDPVVLSRREEADYTVEEIEFASIPSVRIPATVVIPRNNHQKHPAVV
ncbi:MAG: hypothetical protein V4507_16090, partial [Verrucomicrobiota bacterium]